jgi:hypothetical protein
MLWFHKAMYSPQGLGSTQLVSLQMLASVTSSFNLYWNALNICGDKTRPDSTEEKVSSGDCASGTK